MLAPEPSPTPPESSSRREAGWLTWLRGHWADAADKGRTPFCVDGTAVYVGLDSARADTLVQAGAPVEAVTGLSTLLDMGAVESYGVLGVDKSTVSRWSQAHKSAPPAVTEQLLRVLDLAALAATVFGTLESGIQWLRRPHPVFLGRAPLVYANNEFAARRVREVLIAIRFGGVV